MADFAPQTTYADLLKKLKTPGKPPMDVSPALPTSPQLDTSPATIDSLKKKKPTATLLNQL